MDDHADFDSVSWQRGTAVMEHPQNPVAAPMPNETTLPTRSASGRRKSSEPQAVPHADGVDLGGIGDGVLECTVDTPLKEAAGTKDAYISYLVTSHVSHLRERSDQALAG
jgi:sorting nexin-4